MSKNILDELPYADEQSFYGPDFPQPVENFRYSPFDKTFYVISLLYPDYQNFISDSDQMPLYPEIEELGDELGIFPLREPFVEPEDLFMSASHQPFELLMYEIAFMREVGFDITNPPPVQVILPMVREKLAHLLGNQKEFQESLRIYRDWILLSYGEDINKYI